MSKENASAWAGIGSVLLGIGLPATGLLTKEAGYWMVGIGFLCFVPKIYELASQKIKSGTPQQQAHPKGIELKFDPTNPSFLFEDSSVQNRDVIYFKWARVAVKNCLPRRQAIKVELVGMKPCPPQLIGRFPLALHFKDDNNPPYMQSKEISSNDHQFVDVVSNEFRSTEHGETEDKFVLQHAVSGVVQDFEPGDYRITLEAVGETDSDRRTYLIGLGRDRKFYMRSTTLYRR